MRRQDRVVRLDDRRSHVWSGVDHELEFRLLGVVHDQLVHQEGGESGSSAAPEGVEDDEALKSVAVVGHGSNPVDDQINLLQPNRKC